MAHHPQLEFEFEKIEENDTKEGFARMFHVKPNASRSCSSVLGTRLYHWSQQVNYSGRRTPAVLMLGHGCPTKATNL